MEGRKTVELTPRFRASRVDGRNWELEEYRTVLNREDGTAEKKWVRLGLFYPDVEGCARSALRRMQGSGPDAEVLCIFLSRMEKAAEAMAKAVRDAAR